MCLCVSKNALQGVLKAKWGIAVSKNAPLSISLIFNVLRNYFILPIKIK